MTRFLFVLILAAFVSLPIISPAAEVPPPRTSWQENAESDIRAAEKDLHQAGKEITGAVQQDVVRPVVTPPVNNAPTPSVTPTPEQKTTKKTLSTTQRKTTATGRSANSARDAAMVGSPETGYSGIWTDRNGDIVTSVIAPTPPPRTTQTYPIIIEPQVNPPDWGYNSYSNWNTGWGNSYWPQGPGYGTPPPPPPGGFTPPPAPWEPGGMPPSLNPVPSYPPPSAPGYRPLRPGGQMGWNQPGHNPGMGPGGQGWQPGMNPAPKPPNSGWNPGTNPPPPNGGPSLWNPGMGAPSSGPGWQPGTNPPPPMGGMGAGGPGWQPGGTPPGGGIPAMPSPGMQPSPSFRPLPMQPGGNTWRSGQGGGRGPLFGRGGM